ADVNGDGKIDLVASTQSGSTAVSVLLATGTCGAICGTFLSPVTYTVGTSPRAIAGGDFNEDAKIDVVTANFSANTFSYLQGSGTGTFATATTFTTGTGPDGIAVADFNHDSHLDLAISNATSNNVSIFLGIGNGSFSSGVGYNAGTAPSAIATGDFNGD